MDIITISAALIDLGFYLSYDEAEDLSKKINDAIDAETLSLNACWYKLAEVLPVIFDISSGLGNHLIRKYPEVRRLTKPDNRVKGRSYHNRLICNFGVFVLAGAIATDRSPKTRGLSLYVYRDPCAYSLKIGVTDDLTAIKTGMEVFNPRCSLIADFAISDTKDLQELSQALRSMATSIGRGWYSDLPGVRGIITRFAKAKKYTDRMPSKAGKTFVNRINDCKF